MNPTKTVFIFDSCGERPICFYIKEGDYSHLNGVYVNTYTEDEKEQNKQDEVNLLFYTEDGTEKDIPKVDKFPVERIDGYTKVVVIGFLP